MMLKGTENNARIFREDLPPEKKITILQTNADAHNKKRESLSPEDKELFDKKNAVRLKKRRKSLTPIQRDQVLKKCCRTQKTIRVASPGEKSKTHGNQD